MGLLDYSLNPYQGGLLGALGVNDLAGIARSYGGFKSPWPDSQPDPLNGDQSGSTPMASASPSLMPAFSSVQSTEGQQPQTQTAGGPWIRPGSILDKIFNLPGLPGVSQANAAAPQMSGAEPSAAWTGGANVPLPLPRPAMPAPQQFAGPIFSGDGSQSSMGGGYGGGAFGPAPAQAQMPPQAQSAMAQAQPQQSFNPLSRIGGALQDVAAGFSPGLRAERRPVLQETGVDPFTGQKTFAWVDPNKQTITPANASAGGGDAQGGASLATFQNAQRKGVTGEALYQYLPESLRPLVKQYVEGKAPIPTAAALRNPAVIAIMQAANAIDPTFDAANYPARANMIKEYAKGSPSSLGGQRNSGNTAVGHLGTVSQAAVDLGNWDVLGPDVSKGLNWLREHGSTEQAAKANALNNAIDRYVAEVGKYYSGSASGGVHEREAARQRFSSTKTPAELAAAIASERELFHSKLDQLKEQAVATLGENHPLTKEIIQPHAVEGFKLVDKNLNILRGGKPSSEPKTGGLSAGTYNWTPSGITK